MEVNDFHFIVSKMCTKEVVRTDLKRDLPLECNTRTNGMIGDGRLILFLQSLETSSEKYQRHWL